jgi:hypothetical protein
MKVLREPPKNTWKRDLPCDGCGAILEVEHADLTLVADQREGDAYTFACPCCRKVNWLARGFVR